MPQGRVAIAWNVAADDAGRQALRFDWVETGGAPIAEPPRRLGFGSRVLETTVRHQLGGAVSLDWRPSGLVCRLAFPLRGAGAPAAAPECWTPRASGGGSGLAGRGCAGAA